MTLLISMLPFYLLGNLHCMGMCGPLVMMLGRHQYRLAYFFGRVLSFSLAGLLAGEVGAVLNASLQTFHLSALVSLLFGGMIFASACMTLLGGSLPGVGLLSGVNHALSLLILHDRPWHTFLFGFFTVLLPCGQSFIVFSACALSQDPFVGWLNGFAFALLTSPSLFLAMHATRFFSRVKHYDRLIIGGLGILIGTLALCRGLADLALIPHLVIHSGTHIVLF